MDDGLSGHGLRTSYKGKIERERRTARLTRRLEIESDLIGRPAGSYLYAIIEAIVVMSSFAEEPASGLSMKYAAIAAQPASRRHVPGQPAAVSKR